MVKEVEEREVAVGRGGGGEREKEEICLHLTEWYLCFIQAWLGRYNWKTHESTDQTENLKTDKLLTFRIISENFLNPFSFLWSKNVLHRRLHMKKPNIFLIVSHTHQPRLNTILKSMSKFGIDGAHHLKSIINTTFSLVNIINLKWLYTWEHSVMEYIY